MTSIMRVLLCFLILIAHIGYGSQSVEVVEELTVEQTGTITIPQVAEGYEDDYRLFLSGKLIYKPNPDSDVGKIEMRIVDLTNPLGSEFDLSACGDIGNHLRISTGYRKSKIEAQDKLEIWFSPLFLIERELGTTAMHFQEFMGKFKSSKWKEEENIGFFWNLSDHDLDWYNYATKTFYHVSKKNYGGKYNDLYDNMSSHWYHGPSQAQIHLFSHYKHLGKFRLAFEIWPEKPNILAVPLPLERSSEIPEVARGYEEAYLMFLGGRLVYKPNRTGDTDQIELAIADLPNPLDGEFDLSNCGDMWKYVSINTGYRKGKQTKNRFKTEVWFVPRFVVERELNSTASHLRPIMDKWPARFPVGIFCTWGDWNSSNYTYLVTQTPEGLSDGSLHNHIDTSLEQGNFNWYISARGLDARLGFFCIQLASETSLRIRKRGESVIRQACASDFQAASGVDFPYFASKITVTTPNGVCIIGKTYTSSGPDFPSYQENYLYGTNDSSNPGYIQYCPSGKKILSERLSKLYWEQIILPALEVDARKFDSLSLSEFPWKWEQDGEGYHYSGWGYW